MYIHNAIKSPVRDHRIALERAGNDMMKYD